MPDNRPGDHGPSPFPTLTDDDGVPPGVVILRTSDEPSIVLIRIMVGWVFLWAGLMKFLSPATYGAGAFDAWGIPFPDLMGPLVGAFEIGCALLVLFGVGVRVSVLPLMVIIFFALVRVQIPAIGSEGLLFAIQEAHLDVAMLLATLFLLRVGAGPRSVDARIAANP